MKTTIPLDKVVSAVAALGVPGLVFVFTVAVCGSAGLFGAAAVSTSLCAIGPGGMIGGLISLGVISLLALGITQFGIGVILTECIVIFKNRGTTKEELIHQIENYPLSSGLRHKLIKRVEFEWGKVGVK